MKEIAGFQIDDNALLKLEKQKMFNMASNELLEKQIQYVDDLENELDKTTELLEKKLRFEKDSDKLQNELVKKQKELKKYIDPSAWDKFVNQMKKARDFSVSIATNMSAAVKFGKAFVATGVGAIINVLGKTIGAVLDAFDRYKGSQNIAMKASALDVDVNKLRGLQDAEKVYGMEGLSDTLTNVWEKMHNFNDSGTLSTLQSLMTQEEVDKITSKGNGVDAGLEMMEVLSKKLGTLKNDEAAKAQFKDAVESLGFDWNLLKYYQKNNIAEKMKGKTATRTLLRKDTLGIESEQIRKEQESNETDLSLGDVGNKGAEIITDVASNAMEKVRELMEKLVAAFNDLKDRFKGFMIDMKYLPDRIGVFFSEVTSFTDKGKEEARAKRRELETKMALEKMSKGISFEADKDNVDVEILQKNNFNIDIVIEGNKVIAKNIKSSTETLKQGQTAIDNAKG